MSKLRQIIVLMLLVTLSFQVIASTLMDLCRAECEQAVKSELIKYGSVSNDSVVFSPCNGMDEMVSAVKHDGQSTLELSSCSLCQQCVHVGVALLSLPQSESNAVAPLLTVVEASPVAPSDQERPFKPPRLIGYL